MKIFIKIYLKFINNFWKIILLKLAKTLISTLLLNISIKNNIIFSYINEQGHAVLFIIALGIVASSISLMVWFKDSILDCNQAIALLNYEGYINERVSLEDARLSLLAKDEITYYRNGEVAAEAILAVALITGFVLMTFEYNEIKSIKARKFAQDLKKLRIVLL